MINWYENPVSIEVMKAKYLHEGEKDHYDLIHRVCSIFTPDLGEKVQQLMFEGRFFPAGRSLYGAGSKGKFNATMSNCYIMDSPKDSLDSIYETNRKIAKIFKSGGGIGVNLSLLRPCGSKTNNAARTSTGAVSFVNLFNTTGEIIGFHGRRGATLVGLNINHPDIEEFVDLRKHHDLKAMNISCLIDDKFMNAVINDDDYKLEFFVEATGEHIEKIIRAKDLWDKIMKMNWDYGDPGMLFMDHVRNYNLQCHNNRFHIDICNPCAEYTGPAYNSCNLGSLDLYKYVSNKFMENAVFDHGGLMYDTSIAIRALDEILDYGYDMQPLDENKRVVTDWRSIGLGFFGFADMLIAIGIKYGSPESIEIAEEICRDMFIAAVDTSADLAAEKGKFKMCNKKAILSSPLMQQVKEYAPDVYKKVEKYGMRNAQLLSIAPTGSLSILDGQASSGIEPLFQLFYERSTHGLEDQGISFKVSSRSIVDLMETLHLSTEAGVRSECPWVITTHEINPIDRVRVQGAMQKWVDNAISSTVTMDHKSTVEDISNVYMEAWKQGLKGITIFRNDCKRANILGVNKNKNIKPLTQAVELLENLDNTKMPDKLEIELYEQLYDIIGKRIVLDKAVLVNESHDTTPGPVVMNTVLPISRKTKDRLEGSTYRKRTACVKSLYVTVNRDEDGNIFEVFTNKSIHGCTANIATITRMTSLALRSGVKVDKVIEELKSNTCQACITLNKEHPEYKLSLSCPYAIAEALEEEYNREKKMDQIMSGLFDSIKKDIPIFALPIDTANINKETAEEDKVEALECPKCHKNTLIPEGKCCTCISCGYSKCD